MAVPYVCRRKFTKIATTGRLQNRFSNKLVSNLTNIVKVAMTQNKVAKQPKRIKCLQEEYKNIRSLLLIN